MHRSHSILIFEDAISDSSTLTLRASFLSLQKEEFKTIENRY